MDEIFRDVPSFAAEGEISPLVNYKLHALDSLTSHPL